MGDASIIDAGRAAASPGPPYHPGATIEREEPPQGL